MTTAIVTEAPRRLDFPHAGTGMRRVIRSEWTKFWSVRSTFWTLLSLVVVTVGFSTLIAWGTTSSLHKMSAKDLATLDPTSLAMAGIAFGQLAVAVLGALIVSSEFTTGGIKPTLSAVPNRLRVLAAKGIVFATVAFVIGTITAFGSFFVSMLFWNHYHMGVSLGAPNVLRAVIGGGLIIVGSGMFGFALAALLRHTAGAISTAVGLLFVAPALTGFLPGSWGHSINHYFTVNAGHHITDVVKVTGELQPWPGYLVFTIQWAVVLLAGAFLMRRRDA
jgi:ABC-2 type transport system permease protein